MSDKPRTGLWAPPDPALAAAGIEGETLVARVRLVAMALLLISPTVKLVTHPEDPIHRVGFAVTVIAALAAVGIWWTLRRGRWRPWIGFASSTLDVSLVTTALVTFLVVGSPLIALNSKVTFEIYFLAIVATSLRYDPRICLTVGLLALAQYGGLWAYSALAYDLHDPIYVPDGGDYSAIDQLTRIILLGVTVILSLTIVLRARRLLYLSARDRLTGLYNRGHFDRTLLLELERGDRYHRPLALAMLDIDHFKDVNDRHGHLAGDRVLRAIADLLATNLRRTDVVARFGGEEFVVLLPETTRDDAASRIEGLRKLMTRTPVVLDDGKQLEIGFSAGVAAYPEDPHAIDAGSLLARADSRLLIAKRTGRGKTVAADA